MNPYGSYRALRDNSKAAMLAAIEVYNKPQFQYRDECFVVLLINAWELLLKAMLSKNRRRIYYPKKRGQPYRTFSLSDALGKAKNLFPPEIPFDPVEKNIGLLSTYRDNAIHFYNEPGFSVVVYGLAQTSIINYVDLMSAILGVNLSDEITIALLPLGLGNQPDPIEFLRQAKANPPRNKATAEFLREMAQATDDLDKLNLDTGRFLTVFTVALQSVKKVTSADVVVGITSGSAEDSPTIIERRIDPNKTHPLPRKRILEEIGPNLNGMKFTSHTFEAIAWALGIKEKPHLCWRAAGKGGITRYSPEVVSILRRMTKTEIKNALDEYRTGRRGN